MPNVTYDTRRVGSGKWNAHQDAEAAFGALENHLRNLPGPYQIHGMAGKWGPTFPLAEIMRRVRTRFANHDPGIKLLVRGRRDDDPRYGIRKVLEIPTEGLAIVKLAYQQLGDEYTWAAEGPNEFDCSGLTKYCYEHAASEYLPHSAYQQYHDTVVQLHDETKLVPGDLLFYDASDRPSPNHVGIYAGMDEGIRKVIDASSSADQIVYRAWNLNPLIGYGYLPSVTGPH